MISGSQLHQVRILPLAVRVLSDLVESCGVYSDMHAHADFLAALAETLPSITEAMEREYAEVGKRLRQAMPQRDSALGHYL